MKRDKRVFITTVLLAVLAGAVVAAVIIISTIRSYSEVDTPMPFTNETMVYASTAEVGLMTEKASTYSLCVGSDNVANENIEIDPAESAALFDIENRRVLFAKSMYEQIYPASVTKIMTAIVAMKYGNLDQRVTVIWRDLELEAGSQVSGIHIGDKLTLRALVHALLVHSGNDAALAIARIVGNGSVEAFVEMMNEECKRIGATNTHFVNPTGLHDENHYTTVYDIYLMLSEAIKYDDFVSIMQISVFDLGYTASDGTEGHVTLDSTDHYLTGEYKAPKDVTVLGGKTGTTAAAGHCLAILSQNAYGQPFISIIMGAPTTDGLYKDMNTLLAQINS